MSPIIMSLSLSPSLSRPLSHSTALAASVASGGCTSVQPLVNGWVSWRPSALSRLFFSPLNLTANDILRGFMCDDTPTSCARPLFDQTRNVGRAL